MKRLLSCLLSLALILALAPPALAASEEAINAANALYELGLFGGTGTDANGNPIFDLDRAPTRHEAITMLVRLLGKTDEAENGTWDIPFTDVAEWAKPYVGYAYANGLAGGTSATTFAGNENVSASQYLTFVLRALGYESGTDFQWDSAWELSDRIGLTNGQYASPPDFLGIQHDVLFTRGDVAIISYNALDTQLASGSSTLRQTLPTKPTATRIPEEEKLELLNAYAEKMYCVALCAVYLQMAQNAAVQHNVADAIYWTAMVRTAHQDECAVLERMKNLCAGYTDTAELKRCIEEDIRLKSMGPQTINSMEDASEYMKIIGDSDYSKAYRANTERMKEQLYILFSEETVTTAVEQYLNKKMWLSL